MMYTVKGPVLTYRPIRYSDHAVVADAFSDWQPHRTGRRWDIRMSLNATQELAARQQLVRIPLTDTSEHQETLVALSPRGEPVGLSVSRCNGRHIHARNQAVVPHMRGRGYWSALVDDLMTFAFLAQGAELITFDLWHDDDAAGHMIESRRLERDGAPAPGRSTGRLAQRVRITREAFDASGRATAVTWEGVS